MYIGYKIIVDEYFIDHITTIIRRVVTILNKKNHTILLHISFLQEKIQRKWSHHKQNLIIMAISCDIHGTC